MHDSKSKWWQHGLNMKVKPPSVPEIAGALLRQWQSHSLLFFLLNHTGCWNLQCKQQVSNPNVRNQKILLFGLLLSSNWTTASATSRVPLLLRWHHSQQLFLDVFLVGDRSGCPLQVRDPDLEGDGWVTTSWLPSSGQQIPLDQTSDTRSGSLHCHKCGTSCRIDIRIDGTSPHGVGAWELLVSHKEGKTWVNTEPITSLSWLQQLCANIWM